MRRFLCSAYSSLGMTRDVISRLRYLGIFQYLHPFLKYTHHSGHCLNHLFYRSVGVTGELLVDGQPRNEQLFQSSSCYITQEDLLQPLLTVREAMDVAVSLKLAKGSVAHADQILQELGLLEHQNTKTDLLSGGQKKR